MLAAGMYEIEMTMNLITDPMHRSRANLMLNAQSHDEQTHVIFPPGTDQFYLWTCLSVRKESTGVFFHKWRI
jgi:hypothetical protein